MNIKVKAALEITVGIAAMVAVAFGVKTGLEALTEVYGIKEVLNGLAFGALSIAGYVAVSLLYDMRVAQLRYLETLKEIVKK